VVSSLPGCPHGYESSRSIAGGHDDELVNEPEVRCKGLRVALCGLRYPLESPPAEYAGGFVLREFGSTTPI
jgi:hypothetical protein